MGIELRRYFRSPAGYRADGFTSLFDLVFPRQLIKRRLVATGSVTIFRHVELLMLVVFDSNTMLSAPAVAFSIDPMCVHMCRIYSRWC